MPHRSVTGLEGLASALIAMGAFLAGIFGLLYALARQELPSSIETSDATDDLRRRMRRRGPILTVLGAVALLAGLTLRLVA